MKATRELCTIGKNIELLLEDFDSKDFDRLFNKDIASAIHVEASSYSKKIGGDAKFTTDDIMALVDFFNNKYSERSIDKRITADDLLYGCHNEKEELTAHCLDTRSLKWLDEFSSGENNSEHIKMLNILLSGIDNIGERLLNIALYYCYSGNLCISLSGKHRESLSNDISEKMIRSLALNDMAELLLDISNAWNEKYVHDNAQLLSAFRKGKASKEERVRMYSKYRSNTQFENGIPQTTELICKVHELSKKQTD